MKSITRSMHARRIVGRSRKVTIARQAVANDPTPKNIAAMVRAIDEHQTAIRDARCIARRLAAKGL